MKSVEILKIFFAIIYQNKIGLTRISALILQMHCLFRLALLKN